MWLCPEDHLTVEIAPVDSSEDLDAARHLFAEYSAALTSSGVGSPDRRTAEIAALPGEYAAPHGRLLLARIADAVVGGVALRRLPDGSCELKRLYVRPGSRGQGVGRALAVAAIGEAAAMGYAVLRLDTLPWMSEARALYRELGFREVPPYRPIDIAGILFMELELTSPSSMPAPA